MKFGFVGGGKMAEALIAGLLRTRSATPSNIVASDISADRRRALKARHKILVTDRNADAARAGVVVLAVKPQQLVEVLAEVGPVVTRRALSSPLPRESGFHSSRNDCRTRG
jgi:pyrroline-5-carboxylate reductase